MKFHIVTAASHSPSGFGRQQTTRCHPPQDSKTQFIDGWHTPGLTRCLYSKKACLRFDNTYLKVQMEMCNHWYLYKLSYQMFLLNISVSWNRTAVSCTFNINASFHRNAIIFIPDYTISHPTSHKVVTYLITP